MTSLLNIAGNIPVSAAADAGQSLRFEDGDSAYLSWTPASAGNRRTWTYSFWTKRGSVSATQTYLYSKSGTYGDQLSITEKVAWTPLEATGAAYNMQTNAVLRDPSAWYHIVLSVDTTQATASDRVKIYVNGVLQTLSTASYPAQNYDGEINKSQSHIIGYNTRNNSEYLDSYLANVCFIDGTALTPTSFGEYDGTLWKPKSDTDIQALTFGTNGFYLPFKQTTEAEGFSTVTYSGNGGTQSIEGVGFEPDFVWIKSRNNGSAFHSLTDSVRGVTKFLYSNSTAAEATSSVPFKSFDSSGFTVASDTSTSRTNVSGENYVAWCWDAGSGSAVSNTDGSITSSVKANTTNGFSIVSYTGNGTAGATVGHGLTSTPEMVISKNRDDANNWLVYHKDLDASNPEQKRIFLNLTDAVSDSTTPWNDTAPTSSLLTLGTSGYTNGSSDDMIMYAFHSVSGYSSIGSYSGTGASNAINCGFKPAFVMIKATDDVESWVMMDNTRDPNIASITDNLLANVSLAENAVDGDRVEVEFTSTGFTLKSTQSDSINNENGKNYIYMAFADTRDATFFGDTSGNSNNWTPNALNNTDVVPDSPVSGGNFATLNPLDKLNSPAFSEGNLKYTPNTSGVARATIGLNTGKLYFEIYQLSSVSASTPFIYGMCELEGSPTHTAFQQGIVVYNDNGAGKSIFTYVNGSLVQNDTSYFTTTAVGDIWQFAYDADTGKAWVGRNGTWFNSGDPSAGTGFIYQFSGDYTIAPVFDHAGANYTAILNTGADSSFAGNATPQGNTDDNGVGDFYYAPPSGFLALNSFNLPTPAITAPDEYFNTVLYAGTGSSQSITGVNFQPDWVWAKARNGAFSHGLFDSVRGATKRLQSQSTAAEDTTGLTSFDSDGFTTSNYNSSGYNYVAWNWKAGATPSSNTDGSITSTVSANTDAGFSIVSYTGNTTAGATIGHGLSSAPEMVIIKDRPTADNWAVYHSGLGGGNNVLFLESTAAKRSDLNMWNSTAPSSSVITLGNRDEVNRATSHICYAFHSVESYSKIGSYTGNGSTDGTYVHCGFRPAWILIRLYDSGGTNWLIYDNKRDPYNVTDEALLPNSSSAAGGSANAMDITSNGFKFRISAGSVNGNGYNYIFMAFAEAPFSKSNAR